MERLRKMVAERGEARTQAEYRRINRECQALADQLISLGGQDVVRQVHDVQYGSAR